MNLKMPLMIRMQMIAEAGKDPGAGNIYKED
jgi:hypothetical protein